MFYNCEKLEHFGGCINLKTNLDLSYSPKLTHESLMNVINKAAEVSDAPTLRLGSINLAKLTAAEKQIIINKGWILE
jgi:hypothetical protein